MILITSFVLTNNINRNNEISFALKTNSKNKLINQIHVITEDVNIRNLTNNYPNVTVYSAESRVTFKMLVDHANKLNETVIIANSDIVFDNSLIAPEGDVAFCLTRWFPNISTSEESRPLRVWEETNGMSFDSYIFNPPINVDSIDFPIGILGCDGKFAYELHRSGLKVINPSRIIKTGHVHCSEARTYGNDWIKGNYLRVGITNNTEYNPNSVYIHRTVS